jgi:acyl-CoA synthetase (AMP-forming)/AMP-acid ligase II
MFSKLRAMLGLDQLIAVNVGAAPTPVEVLEFFHALGIELAELWGMSETCGAGTSNRPGEVKIGTVGPAHPGVELKIADDGELLVRGDCVMTGYRNSPEKTAEALDADGWLHTGDIGSIDEDGFLTIVDRKKDMIVSGGENVASSEVERVLYEHEAVLEAAVVAMPDARWGEVPRAFVVRKPGHDGLTAEELIAHCRARLAGFKTPKEIAFLGALPRTPSGKVLKRQLREIDGDGGR